MKSILVVALLTAIALAGCADGDKAEQADDPLTPVAPPPEEGRGLIRGVVVDAGIQTIEGATVTLIGEDLSVVTEANGFFIFNDLEPGFYQVRAAKIGFAAAETQVSVEADEANPAAIKIKLAADASSLPSAPTHDFQGYLACNVTAVAIAYPLCILADGQLGEDKNSEVFDMPRVPDYIQGELYWKSTQDAGASLSFNVWAGTSFDPVSVSGVNPLSIRLDKETMLYGNGTETPGEDLFYDDGKFAWRVFSDGVEGTNLGICPDDVPPLGFSCLFGAGITIDQDFTIYTTQFFGIVPADDYMYITDGAHPIDG